MADRKPKTTKNTQSSGIARADSDRAAQLLEARLFQVLTSIATVLLTSGYSYGRLNDLARAAFVEAADRLLRESNSKLSIARIAASTGLPRIEVSRILSRRKAGTRRAADSKNRSRSVVMGWLSDPAFLDLNGRARALPYKGGRYDFQALVKRYSNDIPAKAMLVEMQRLGLVSQTSEGSVQLVRSGHQVSKLSATAMRAIEPWIAMLGETTRLKAKRNLSAKIGVVDLYFDSVPQINAVIRALHKKRAAFIESLFELGARTKDDHRFSARVTIGMAVARPVRAISIAG